MAIQPFFGTWMAERPEVRSSLPIPMVYEHVNPEPACWDYHVLAIDVREQALPDVQQLNVLGRQGWILAGLLDERIAGRGTLVHYYFMRQSKEQRSSLDDQGAE